MPGAGLSLEFISQFGVCIAAIFPLLAEAFLLRAFSVATFVLGALRFNFLRMLEKGGQDLRNFLFH